MTGTARVRRGDAAGIVIIRTALLACLLAGVARTGADPDLWGHVRFGLDILREGLRTADPYSFTADVPWINHEWLAEALMASAWKAGGPYGSGLIALEMLVVAAILVCLVARVRAERVPVPAADLLVVAPLLAMWPRLNVVRPQIFSLLLFAVLLWTLTGAERGHGRRLALVPVLFAAWVNLHGGWIVGAGVLGLWALGSLGAGARVPRAAAFGTVAAALAATLVNPYGLGMWRFLFDTVGTSRPEISDWRPLTDLDPSLVGPWLVTVTVVVLALARGRRRVAWHHALIVIALGAASVRISRVDAFFSLSASMLLARAFADRATAPARVEWTTAALAGAVAATLALLVAGWTVRDQFTCVRLNGEWMPEREAGAFLAGQRLHGRLLTWFDWGEYAIWHVGPELRVSFDGRRETVYSQAFQKRHRALYYTPDKAAAFLDDLEADYAWLPVTLPLSAALERAGWTTMYRGPVSVVFAHRPTATAPPIALGPACFPGP